MTHRDSSQGRNAKANISEVEKGRQAFKRGTYRTKAEKIALGRELLEKNAALAWGEFGRWRADAGITPRMSHKCMRLAQESDKAA